MRPLRLAIPLLLAALAAGCASGEAFVERDYAEPHLQKPKLPGYEGAVVVCYGDNTPMAQVDALATEACAAWGLKALTPAITKRWQCRLTVPHQASYTCIDPEMRFANGNYVNPFSKADVQRWRDEQAEGPAPVGRKAAREKAAKQPQ